MAPEELPVPNRKSNPQVQRHKTATTAATAATAATTAVTGGNRWRVD